MVVYFVYVVLFFGLFYHNYGCTVTVRFDMDVINNLKASTHNVIKNM